MTRLAAYGARVGRRLRHRPFDPLLVYQRAHPVALAEGLVEAGPWLDVMVGEVNLDELRVFPSLR